MISEHLSDSKKKFQLERLILFSDAVFAIAITLLVIEIKVPELPREVVTEQSLFSSLLHMTPKFFGFVISFLIIGQYWTVHHKMFAYVINYNVRLLWLNLFLLLSIVLMPFSTAFWSQYSYSLLKSPLIIYVFNITFLGLMNFFMWRYIANPKRALTAGLSRPLANYFSLRSIVVPVIFMLMGIVYLFVSPFVGVWLPLFIPVVMRLLFAKTKKKLKL